MTIKQRELNVKFLNKGDKTAEILLYDEIGSSMWGGGIDLKDFAQELKALGDLEKLKVRINSGGGDCFVGFGIYNLLNQHPAEITICIDGMAASIASVIAMAGDEIQMAEASHMMIHDPWGFSMGTSGDMRETADLLDKLRDTIAGVYASRTGRPIDTFRASMGAETWYSAKEALDAGLCTEITNNKALAARLDTTRFNYKNMPKDLVVEQEESKEASLKITLDVDASAMQTALDAANKSLEEIAAKLKAFENAADTDDEETLEPKPDEVPEETEDVENSAVPWKLNLAKRKQELAKARGE